MYKNFGREYTKPFVIVISGGIGGGALLSKFCISAMFWVCISVHYFCGQNFLKANKR